MHSLRALFSEFGWRRRAFSLVVLVTLGLFGLVAKECLMTSYLISDSWRCDEY